jgi:uncharacterized protein YecT (DUF1311 family)
MHNQLVITPLMVAMLIVQQAQGGQPCDDIEKAVHACVPRDAAEVSPAELACLRSVQAKAEREMNEAYQQRLKITVASARRDLASIQKLWAHSIDANCKHFANNTESAARYECLIGAMIERKQTLEVLD